MVKASTSTAFVGLLKRLFDSSLVLRDKYCAVLYDS